MKLPKTFTLAGILWTVEETEAITEMGHCNAETATIRLRSGLSAQVKAATFCHELQHAIRYTLGAVLLQRPEESLHGELSGFYLWLVIRARGGVSRLPRQQALARFLHAQ